MVGAATSEAAAYLTDTLLAAAGVAAAAEEAKGVAEAEDKAKEAEKSIEEMLSLLTAGKDNLIKVVTALPPEVGEYLDSPEFEQGCLDRFKELDADCSGVLCLGASAAGDFIIGIAVEYGHEVSRDSPQAWP